MKVPKLIHALLAGVCFLCGCSQTDLLNAMIPDSGYTVVKNIAYQPGDRGKLDIYVPAQMAAGHPVAVFSYGGSWQEGNKNDYLFLGQALASKGIMVVIADYRLYPEVYFPSFMEDTAAAFVWAHRHIAAYGGNPRNLFAVGHSAGGYNAVMLTLNRDYLKAAGGSDGWIKGTVGIAGPYDFLPLTDPALIAIFSKRPPDTSQPITFARPHTPPMLLLTGDADEDVLPRNSYNLAAKMAALGDDVTVKTYPDVAHIGIILSFADGFRSKSPALQDTVDFILRHTTVP